MEAKDVVTGLGLLITLGFNVLNYRRTSQLRSDTLKLDEFKRLRAAVDAAFLEVKSHKATLKGLELSGSAPAKVRKEVQECNISLTATYEKLIDGLSDLDKSTLVAGQDWVSCTAPAWDEIALAFDGCYIRGKDLSAIKLAIRMTINKIDALLSAVQNRLDQAIK